MQCIASAVASRDTLVRNKTIVTTVASNVSRERLDTVYTTDHPVGSQICISRFACGWVLLDTATYADVRVV